VEYVLETATAVVGIVPHPGRSAWAGFFWRKICWCRRADSNRQPIAYEAIALPLSYCGVQKEFVSNFYQTSRPQLKRRNQRSPIGPRFFSMDARVKPGHDEED
jgi:hypothetical protein